MSIPLAVPDRVVLVTGTGHAETEPAAFDRALHAAGVHDANVVGVSSVVPPDAEVTVEPDRAALAAEISPGGLYPMVVARASASGADAAGRRLTAGVAAGRFADGRGVNVEADGVGETEASIRTACRRMLTELADTRDVTLDTTTSVVATDRVPEEGVGVAVAAAVYL